MSHVLFLETIGEALLPAVADGSASFDPLRLGRDVWATWARENDPAVRQADMHAIATLPVAELRRQIDDVVRRLLPGKAGSVHAALTRYLSALVALMHRLEPRGIDHAEDLLRRLPPRVPLFLPGDR